MEDASNVRSGCQTRPQLRRMSTDAESGHVPVYGVFGFHTRVHRCPLCVCMLLTCRHVQLGLPPRWSISVAHNIPSCNFQKLKDTQACRCIITNSDTFLFLSLFCSLGLHVVKFLYRLLGTSSLNVLKCHIADLNSQ